jgi:hypothetical protein
MSHEVQGARIAGQVTYDSMGGMKRDLPYGPCLIERIDDQRVDVIWGRSGEHSAVLPLSALVSAAKLGSLVLLD